MSSSFWKIRVANAGLIIVAGTLTFTAIICLVFFASPWGDGTNNLAIPAVKASQIHEQTTAGSQPGNTSTRANSRNGEKDPAVINIDASGPSSGGTGIVSNGGSNIKDSAKGNIPGNGGGATDPSAPGAVLDPAASTGTGNSADTGSSNPVIGGGSGASSTVSGGTSGNGSTGGSNPAGSTLAGDYKVKSACYGGDGHCYTDELLKR
jgi:hypothetical protein